MMCWKMKVKSSGWLEIGEKVKSKNQFESTYVFFPYLVSVHTQERRNNVSV